MMSTLIFMQGVVDVTDNGGLIEGLLKTIFPFLYGREESSWLLPSIFIGIIIAVFVFFLWYAFQNYYRSKSKINQLEREFERVSRDSIHTDFEDLKSRILNTGKYDFLWREFEKSIIKINENGGTKVYCTTDAGRHFNEQTIVKNQLNIRLLNSAAGILVTLGLIGTFIGISAGLGEISFTGQNSSQLTQGITTLLSGAQVAFSSSVWGLFLSLLFNLFEKNLIQKLSVRVSNLQRVIDNLFEKKSSEEILAQSLSEERQQTIQLQTFNDDLVLRLGEVLDKSIQENFNPVLEMLIDAVQELTEFKRESATEALQNMIEEFKSSLTAGANSQLEELSGTLKQTAELLNQANEKTATDQEQMQLLLSNHLNEFEDRVDNIMNDVVESQRDLNGQQREALNGVLQSLQNGVDKTDQHFKSLLEDTESSVNSNLVEIKNMFSTLSEDYEQNLKDLKSHFTSEKETMGEMIERINSQLKAFDKSVSAMNDTSSNIKEILPILNSTTTNLKDSTNRFKESQEEFLSDISEYLIQTKSITSGNRELIDEIRESLQETRSHWSAYEDKFNGIKDDLSGVFDELSDGLTTYQEKTRAGLVSSLNEFDGIMGKSIGSLSTGIDELKEILESIEEKTE